MAYWGPTSLSDSYKFDPTGTLNKLGSYGGESRKRWQDFSAGQRADTDAYLNDFGSFVRSQEALPAMATRLGKELNLPSLRQNALNLNLAVQKAPENVRRSIQGFGTTTQTQLDRAISAQLAKLSPAAQQAATLQQAAEGQLGQNIGYGLAEREFQMLPLQERGKFLSERLSREATGFGQTEERELNALTSKLQVEGSLTQAEMSRLSQLAGLEQDYKKNQDTLANQLKIAQMEDATKRYGYDKQYQTAWGGWS